MKSDICKDYFDQSKEDLPDYLTAREITGAVYNTEALHIRTLAMDFPTGTTLKFRKELDAQWRNVLPELNEVKALWVRHLANDDFLEAICDMKNLEWLYFEQSAITNLAPLARLKKLKRLELRSSKLKDLSPVTRLTNLEVLAIEGSFNVTNYEVIGRLTNLKALKLSGERFAPKNLKLKSLKPLTGLQNLQHLDLTGTTVEDKSYDAVLQLGSLQRLDMVTGASKQMAETIKSQHKTLKAGTITTWNFGGKNYEIEKLSENPDLGVTVYRIT